MFAITPVTEADYQQWLVLWAGYLGFYQTSLSEEVTATTFKRILDGQIQAAIAKDESGKCIGLVHWITHRSSWSVEQVCYLEDLFVANEYRKQGVGEALIGTVKNWAKSQGLTKVYWLTAETNFQARSLYDQLAKQTGFIQYEVEI